MNSVRYFNGNLGRELDAVAVIMAGGSGTRFWPWSRIAKPKQFLPLGGGERSLLQLTQDRVLGLTGNIETLVVTSEIQRELVAQHVPDVAVLVEPHARNTAPCLAYAAAQILERVGDVPLLCMPADHVISHAKAVSRVFAEAIELAASEQVLVTIGIVPSYPETGYGYLKSPDDDLNPRYRRVEQFVEKPNRERAEEYIISGDYFWNAGIFAWRPSVLFAALERHQPELFTLAQVLRQHVGKDSENTAIEEFFGAVPSISIDVGVMEKADNVVMIPGADLGWSDVGSWSSWRDVARPGTGDEYGNVVRGTVEMLGSRNCVVVGEERPIAVIGLENIVIVDTPDALLVCHAEESQRVKEIVERLKALGKTELL